MYKEFTKQGYKIVERGSYITSWVSNRVPFVIFYREKLNDYNIALNYCYEDGTWAQGIYEFRTIGNALDYLKETKQKVITY